MLLMLARTGEHALTAAPLGLDATGIDFSPKAIRLAENVRPRAGSLIPISLVVDALEIESRGADSGRHRLDLRLISHVFDDRDQRRALSVASV